MRLPIGTDIVTCMETTATTQTTHRRMLCQLVDIDIVEHREATAEEAADSDRAMLADGGCGVIISDEYGDQCWVTE